MFPPLVAFIILVSMPFSEKVKSFSPQKSEVSVSKVRNLDVVSLKLYF